MLVLPIANSSPFESISDSPPASDLPSVLDISGIASSEAKVEGVTHFHLPVRSEETSTDGIAVESGSTIYQLVMPAFFCLIQVFVVWVWFCFWPCCRVERMVRAREKWRQMCGKFIRSLQHGWSYRPRRPGVYHCGRHVGRRKNRRSSPRYIKRYKERHGHPPPGVIEPEEPTRLGKVKSFLSSFLSDRLSVVKVLYKRTAKVLYKRTTKLYKRYPRATKLLLCFGLALVIWRFSSQVLSILTALSLGLVSVFHSTRAVLGWLRTPWAIVLNPALSLGVSVVNSCWNVGLAGGVTGTSLGCILFALCLDCFLGRVRASNRKKGLDEHLRKKSPRRKHKYLHFSDKEWRRSSKRRQRIRRKRRKKKVCDRYLGETLWHPLISLQTSILIFLLLVDF